MATQVLSVKLLVNKKTGKVLFAEAGKDFVDFLFSLLTLPVGFVIKLLSEKHQMVGCIGKLYESVEKLDSIYMQSNASKRALLHPNQTASFTSSLDTSSQFAFASKPRAIRVFADGAQNQATFSFGNVPKQSIFNIGNVEDYVKGVVTYMITDNLEVTPMSSISSIALLHRFKVEDLGDLEEKVVKFGLPEGVSLLKASLQSSNALTEALLPERG